MAVPSGVPVVGPINAELHFYAGSTTTSELIPAKSLTGLNLTDGIFSAKLPLTAGEREIVFGAPEVWIGIRDTTHGQTFPRQHFSAVPYALKVPVDSTTLGYDSSGNLFVKGGSSPTSSFTQGAGQFVATGEVKARDNAGLKLSNDSGQGLVVDDSGNIGVGTSTPTTNLDVSFADQHTAVAIRNTSSTTQRYPALSIENYSGATAFPYGHPFLGFKSAGGTMQSPTAVSTFQGLGAIIGYGYDGTSFVEGARISFAAEAPWTAGNHPTQIEFGTNGGSIAQKMFISSAGNVGIGTVTPLGKVQIVENQDAATMLSIHNAAGTSGAYARLGAEADGRWLTMEQMSATFAGTGARRAGYGVLFHSANEGLNIVAGTAPASSLGIYVGGATAADEKIRVDSSGNVGIGSTTPKALLDVQGAGAYDASAQITTAPIRSFELTNNADTPSALPVLTLARNGKSTVSWANVLNLKLSRYNTVGTNAYTQLDFVLNQGAANDPTVNVMTMRDNGNVGIGSTIPTERLDVGTGNVKMGYSIVGGSQSGFEVASSLAAGSWSAGNAVCSGGAYVISASCWAKSAKTVCQWYTNGTQIFVRNSTPGLDDMMCSVICANMR